MNDFTWLDLPHLFAGGAFDVLVGEELRCPLTPDYIPWITDAPEWFDLIARKKVDITDPEIEAVKALDGYFTYKENDSIEQVREYLIGNWHYYTAQEFLYILSIGVYPFSQSHFNLGIVLDAKEMG